MISNRKIAIIVAAAEDLAIGRSGDLLCHMPADMKHFKETTMGHTIVMGRNTWESYPKGALPGRENIVITHRDDYDAPGAKVCHSLENAVENATMDGDVMILGGAQIYAQALPLADVLHLTIIHASFPDADAHFPAINYSEWDEVSRERFDADDRNPHPYTFITLTRKA